MGVTISMPFNKLPGAPGKIRSWAGLVTQQHVAHAVVRAKELVSKDTHETEEHIEAIKTSPFTWVIQSSRPSTDGQFDVPSHLEYKVKAYMRPALEEERGPFMDSIDHVIDALV